MGILSKRLFTHNFLPTGRGGGGGGLILNFGWGAILPKRLVTNVPLPVNKWGGGGVDIKLWWRRGSGSGNTVKETVYKCTSNVQM